MCLLGFDLALKDFQVQNDSKRLTVFGGVIVL